MDTLILQGTNYSSVQTENTVFFNDKSATLLSVTPMQITLRAPLEIGDSIAIRVAVSGSIPFSNTILYTLEAAVVTFGDLSKTELSTSLATDTAGNLYAGHTSSGVEGGILKFTSAGIRSIYALATSGVPVWTSLKMGPGGYLYAARNSRLIARFPPGGGTSAETWLTFPVGTFISDIDFDQTGNLWGGGNNTKIYRIEPNATITSYTFVGNVRSLRVFNDYLYFAARTADGEKIWRAQISPSGLGTPEVYFDFSLAYPTCTPRAITLSSDGVLYIGTDAPYGIVVVDPAKAYIAPFEAYEAMFGTGLSYLAWGSSGSLYASTVEGILLEFRVRGQQSAPYYGSTL